MKGVILAGGTGSRLHPLTRITNKHLLPLYDRPMVTYAVEALVHAGIDEVMLVTDRGQTLRTKVSEIRETGRNAAGVKLIRLDEGDKLVAMAKVDAEEPEEEGAGEEKAPPDATPPVEGTSDQNPTG